MPSSSRREFVIHGSAVASGLMLAGTAPAFADLPGTRDRWGTSLPRRRLGTTGLQITHYGLGGFHLDKVENETDAGKMIDYAIQNGVRFFDTATTYNKGRNEKLLGKYLIPEYRDDIVLMGKTMSRTAADVRADLEQSVESLKTDYIDVHLIHAVRSVEDADRRLNEGVLDILREYKDKGKIGHLGFSGHSDFKAHQHLLAKNIPDLEVCLMPVNVADPSYRSFINGTMQTMVERDMGILAMKSLANGGLFGKGKSGPAMKESARVIPEKISVEQALHFALSMPVAALLNGCESLSDIHHNLPAVKRFEPMSIEEQQYLIARCRTEAETGTMENFKKRR